MSPTSLMTFAEFERLPSDEPGKQELIDGELVTMPPPELIHSEIAKRVFFLLLKVLHPARVWQADTGYRIARGWIEPDISVSWPDQRRDEKYFVGSPMIAVEVLSTREDIERKLTLYFADGAAEVWVLDSARKTMTVYQSQDAGKALRISVQGTYQNNGLIPGLSVDPAEIFG